MLTRVYQQQESPAWTTMMLQWSGGKENGGSRTQMSRTDTISASKIKMSSKKTIQWQTTWKAAVTCIIPEDIRDMIMALAWPSFQPVTLLRVLMASSRSWGLIIMIWPVDMPVLSLPRAEMAELSMLSPRLPAKAAETYRGKKEKS